MHKYVSVNEKGCHFVTPFYLYYITVYLKNLRFFFSSLEPELLLFSMFFTASRELPVSLSNCFNNSFASLESLSGT